MEGFLTFPRFPDALQPLTAPLLGSVQYVPPFDDFGQRASPTVTALVQQSATLVKCSHLAFLMQAWLFFGLLQEFLGLGPIENDCFVENENITIWTEASHGKFRKWRDNVARMPKDARAREKARLKSLLRFAAERCDELETEAQKRRDDDEVFEGIALSVKLLLVTLTTVQSETFNYFKSRKASSWWGWRKEKTDLLKLLKMDEQQARRSLRSQRDALNPLPPGDMTGGPATRLLLRRFIAHQWCFHQALRICREHDYVTANFLASLKRTDASPRGHADCEFNPRCIAYDVDEVFGTKYRGKTCSENCSCAEVGPSPIDLETYINEERIPLISIREKGKKLDLKIVKARPSTAYVAISHVWTDGLGNPAANKMRECQLLRLRDLMTSLKKLRTVQKRTFSRPRTWFAASKANKTNIMQLWRRRAVRPGKPIELGKTGRVLFWMDTLCIPTTDQPKGSETESRIKLLKHKAIKHITPIYAGASSVLVLDGGMQATATGDLDVDNIDKGSKLAAYIYGSNWMQRGWTLEEASLAHNPLFQFQNRTRNFELPIPEMPVGNSSRVSPLQRAQIRAHQVLPLFLRRVLAEQERQLTGQSLGKLDQQISSLLRVPRFMSTWNSLIHRSLTHQQDAFVILANLLDFNIFSTIDLVDRVRIPLLIASCDEIPLSLMFNTGPRVTTTSTPQNGWIPVSFAGSDVLMGDAWLSRQKSGDKEQKIQVLQPDRTVFTLEQLDPEDSTLRIFASPPGVGVGGGGNKISPSTPNFSIFDVQDQQMYVFEQHDFSVWTQDIRQLGTNQRVLTDTVIGTCVIMDKACGSTSLRGYIAKGARFSIMQRSGMDFLYLRYEMPLTVWTDKQWQNHRLKQGRARTPMQYEMLSVSMKCVVKIEFDSSYCTHPLRRRGVYTNRPRKAKILAWTLWIVYLIGFGILGLAAITAWTLVDSNNIFAIGITFCLVSLAYVALLFLIYRPVRRLVANRVYKEWMKTFDEKYARVEYSQSGSGRSTRGSVAEGSSISGDRKSNSFIGTNMIGADTRSKSKSKKWTRLNPFKHHDEEYGGNHELTKLISRNASDTALWNPVLFNEKPQSQSQSQSGSRAGSLSHTQSLDDVEYDDGHEYEGYAEAMRNSLMDSRNGRYSEDVDVYGNRRHRSRGFV